MSYKEKRSQWIENNLKKFSKTGTIIDFGAGDQYWKSYCKHLEYVSLDNESYKKSDGVFDEWKAKPDIIADLNDKLPILDNTYEYGMCIEVLEHLTNPINALGEMIRVLKPEGKLLITAPVNCDLHMTPTIFYSGFFKYWYQHWVPRFDSSIVEIIEAERNTGIMIAIKKND